MALTFSVVTQMNMLLSWERGEKEVEKDKVGNKKIHFFVDNIQTKKLSRYSLREKDDAL